jgi:hypothetical protein
MRISEVTEARTRFVKLITQRALERFLLDPPGATRISDRRLRQAGIRSQRSMGRQYL